MHAQGCIAVGHGSFCEQSDRQVTQLIELPGSTLPCSACEAGKFAEDLCGCRYVHRHL